MIRLRTAPLPTLLGFALTALPVRAAPAPGEGPPTARTGLPAPGPETGWVERSGDVHPGLAAAQPLGAAEPGAPMERMILALKPPPGAESRLERLLAGLRDPRSPDYHQWLTPEQFGEAFGPGPEALDQVTGWLRGCGFRVDEVAAGRLAVTFSGTVAQAERAFRTPIRKFLLGGRVRQANTASPCIPRALAGVVEGVVSLHDIPLRAMNRGFTRVPPGDLAPAAAHHLTPGDFATIYNLGPLFREGVDGSGVSIAVVGRTHATPGDVDAFRQEYKLPRRSPEIIINGADPGDQGPEEEEEADLEMEWSGAVASTPFNLAVGGTQFDEGSGLYWRPDPAPDGSSAIGYIPERAWNESGDAPGGDGLWATGGGASCSHVRPCWQIGPGVPRDPGFRYVPDVALAGAWTGWLSPNVDAVIQAPAADLAVTGGTTVAFRGEGRESVPGGALSCAWGFGDGARGKGPACDHLFLNPGAAPLERRVTFTVTDGLGAWEADARTIKVLPAPAPGERVASDSPQGLNTSFSLDDVSLVAR